jgi:hypothetical protein
MSTLTEAQWRQIEAQLQVPIAGVATSDVYGGNYAEISLPTNGVSWGAAHTVTPPPVEQPARAAGFSTAEIIEMVRGYPTNAAIHINGQLVHDGNQGTVLLTTGRADHDAIYRAISVLSPKLAADGIPE